MPALPLLAIPAAAAGLAYLDARLGISYDYNTIRTLAGVHLARVRAQRVEQHSLFYILEERALSPTHTHRPFFLYPDVDETGKSTPLRVWSYGQAYSLVLRWAGWLRREGGVRRGQIVALDMHNGPAFIWAWFALWSLGAIPAFMNCNLRGAQLAHCVRTAGAKLVLVDRELGPAFTEDDELARVIEEDGVRVVVLNEEVDIGPGEAVRALDEERSGLDWHHMALLIYTSGTTGFPKPAVVSWQKANLGARFVSGWVSMKEDDVFYTCMPLYHTAASVLGVCNVLVTGAAICIGRRFSNRTFWPEVRASKATIIQYVGETCRYLLAAPPSPLDKQNLVRLALGNGLRPDVWQPFKDRFGVETICEFYASTEGPSALWNKSSNDFSAGAIGRNGVLSLRLLKDSMIAVIRTDFETGEPARDPHSGFCIKTNPNEAGELIFRLNPTEGIEKRFQGYYGNTKASSSKILRDVVEKGDAWFSTGDAVRLDNEGRWWFIDRLGDTFRWKSENVSTTEVGHILGFCDAIQEANVYGVLVPKHDGRAGCAAIVLKTPGHTDNDSLETGKGTTTSHQEAASHETSLISSSSPSSSSPPPPSYSSPPPSSLPLRPVAAIKPVAVRPRRLVPAPSHHALERLAAHAIASLPRYSVPIFLRVTRQLATTATNKHQKHVLRQQGIEPQVVAREGDLLYWLRDGQYVPFGEKEWIQLNQGEVTV